jgi:hypothetical protein
MAKAKWRNIRKARAKWRNIALRDQTERQGRLGHDVPRSTARERYRAFVPPSLPPRPPLGLGALLGLIGPASQALGRLSCATTFDRPSHASQKWDLTTRAA